MYSRPTKSTSSAYAISLGIFSSNGDLGSPFNCAYFFQSMFEIYGKEHGAKSVALGCTNIASERCVKFISALFILVFICG